MSAVPADINEHKNTVLNPVHSCKCAEWFNMTTQHTTQAFWIHRKDDGEPFNLVSTQETATELAAQYETEYGEEFEISEETRTRIPKSELPETWSTDWKHRIPAHISVTG